MIYDVRSLSPQVRVGVQLVTVVQSHVTVLWSIYFLFFTLKGQTEIFTSFRFALTVSVREGCVILAFFSGTLKNPQIHDQSLVV